jgi:hypothetical protein
MKRTNASITSINHVNSKYIAQERSKPRPQNGRPATLASFQASIDISGIKIQSFFLKSASSKVNKLSNNICD